MRTILIGGVAIPAPQAIALLVAFGFGGCASASPVVTEALPHETFRLKCQTALPRCLDRAEGICHGNRYTVLRAVDVHDYAGGQGSVGESESRSSEALFRCGTRGKVLWGVGAHPMADTEPSVTPLEPSPAVSPPPPVTKP